MFGRAGAALVYTDKDGEGSLWDVKTDDAFWGVRGYEDLGGGLAAIYHYEWNVDLAGSTGLSGKESTVGLRGPFGTVRVGFMEDPLGQIIDSSGLMNITGTPFALDVPRLSDQIRYDSPIIAGTVFSAAAMVGIDNADDPDGKAIDRWSVGALYNNDGLRFGLGYLRNESYDADQWGLDAAYTTGNITVAGTLEQGDLQLSPTERMSDASSFGVAGIWRLGNNWLKAHGGRRSADESQYELTEYAIGAEHHFSKRTKIYVEYEHIDYKDGQFGDQNQLAIGMRHDF